MKLYIFVFLTLHLGSCSNTQNQSNNSSQSNYNLTLRNEEDNIEDMALDALDEIQVSGSLLYSTFQNHNHNCTGSVNTYKIS